MKSYQVNWKITICSNKFRLIIIRVNRTGRSKTARFWAMHFTGKSSFFFSLPSFLFFRDYWTSKNGGLGGRVAIRITKKRWMKARSPFTRAPDSKLQVVRIDPEIFQDLFLSCPLAVLDTTPERLREYKVWYTAIFSAVMFLRIPHDYICSLSLNFMYSVYKNG